MPNLGSSNSTANKDMMSKIWTNWDTVITELKTWWEKEKSLVTSNFSFSHSVFKSCQLLMCQNENLWSEELEGVYMEEMVKQQQQQQQQQ